MEMEAETAIATSCIVPYLVGIDAGTDADADNGLVMMLMLILILMLMQVLMLMLVFAPFLFGLALFFLD